MTSIVRPALVAVALLLAFNCSRSSAQLLSEAARNAIAERLNEVRAKIEATEDAMYKLAEENDSLVTSRERWYAEMDRVQTEARNAAKDLAQSEIKAKEMQKRVEALQKSSQTQIAADEQLKALRKKLAELKAKEARINKGEYPSIKERTKQTSLDSVTGEIFDVDIEIAQREESLKLSYIGGQALDLGKRLIELESDMVVRGAVKKVHDDRLAQLKSLSPHVTAYLRLARQVEELQILHRKLADLHAQQQIEALKALDAVKPRTVASLGP
jgi:hypothetical protein